MWGQKRQTHVRDDVQEVGGWGEEGRSLVLFKEKDWSVLASKSFIWSHFKLTKEDSLQKEVWKMYNLTFLINSDVSCLQSVSIYICLLLINNNAKWIGIQGHLLFLDPFFKVVRGRCTRTPIFHYLNYSAVTCLLKRQYLIGPRMSLEYAFVSLKKLLFVRTHYLLQK